MQISIIGAGSLGLLFAARLAAASSVTVVTRLQAQAERIERDGITLLPLAGEKQFYNPPACSITHSMTIERSPDWVFLMTKQKDIHSTLLKQLISMVGEDTRVLCFQNGLGHMEQLVEYVAPDKLWAAITTEAARRTGLTEVAHTGQGITVFGPAFADVHRQAGDQEAADKLATVLGDAGLSYRYESCMKLAIWEKLIINAVINPLTALLRIPNGQLCHGKEYIGLMNDLYREAVAVAQAEGVTVSSELWDRIGEICRSTAANHSSMLQDVEAGRQTENEWISGALRQIADKHPIDIPVTTIIYRLIRTMEPI